MLQDAHMPEPHKYNNHNALPLYTEFLAYDHILT